LFGKKIGEEEFFGNTNGFGDYSAEENEPAEKPVEESMVVDSSDEEDGMKSK
jgi:hypothetical protein